jgi:hypothetical protein
VLNLNTNTIEVHSYVIPESSRFPIRELLLAGEPDQVFDPDGWRKHTRHLLVAVYDRALSEFIAGKQVHLDLPQSVHPKYEGQWTVIAAPNLLYNMTHALQYTYDKYLGNSKDLNAEDQKIQTRESELWIDIPISKHLGSSGASKWSKSINVRDLLKSTYACASTLADYAAMFTMEQGKYPRHPYSIPFDEVKANGQVSAPSAIEPPGSKRLSDDQALLDGDVSDDTVGKDIPTAQPASRMPRLALLPSRKTRSVRLVKASWSATKSQLQDRAQYKVTPTTGRPTTRSSARIAKIYPCKGIILVATDDGHVGFEPLSLNEARRHGASPQQLRTRRKSSPTTDTAQVLSNYERFTPSTSQAYVQTDELGLHYNLYTYPSQGSTEPPGTVWKLNRPLSGLAMAPRAWNETLKRFIVDYGFTPVNNSNTFFKCSDPTGQNHMHLIYHIDDILLSFNNDEYGASLVRALLKRFSGSDEGTVHRYLGIDFYWSSGVCLCQLGRRRSAMATPHTSDPNCSLLLSVRLLDCPTADMTADMGTTALPGPAHCKHCDTAMGLLAPTTPAIPADLSKRGGGAPLQLGG